MIARLALLSFIVGASAGVIADEPKGADRFVGTYVSVSTRASEPVRRLEITKEGTHYRLNDVGADAKKRNYFKEFKFVRKTEGQLEDEKGILGTLTFGSIRFEDGKTPGIPVVRLSFCYEHMLLMKEHHGQSLVP